jgi:hypothetical protein
VREIIQAASLFFSIVVLGIISARIYRRDGNWRVWFPMIINMILTIIYYIAVFTVPNIGVLGDFSAALRLETILTFLAYALYMPSGFRRGL